MNLLAVLLYTKSMKKLLAIFVLLTLFFATTTLYLSFTIESEKGLQEKKSAPISPEAKYNTYPYPFSQIVSSKAGYTVDPIPYRNALFITFPEVETITYEQKKRKYLSFEYEELSFEYPQASLSAQIVEVSDNGFLPGVYFQAAVIDGYEGTNVVDITQLYADFESGRVDSSMFSEGRIYTSKSGWQYRLRTVIVPGYVNFYAETMIKDKYYLFRTSELFANIEPPIPSDKNMHSFFWMDQYDIPAREDLLSFIDGIEVLEE